MIIMLNGPFGVGKTTTAERLVSELQHSMLYDPEVAGFLLRVILPDAIKTVESPDNDFQDLELWPELVGDIAEKLVRKYEVNLVVPMTIYNVDYFHYIKNRFKEIDDKTYHFCLMAEKTEIYKRLTARGEEKGSWPFHQTDKCLESYTKHNFEEYIDTQTMDINDVVQLILKRVKRDDNLSK